MREADLERRRQAGQEGRRAHQQPTARKTVRCIGGAFTPHSYAAAIRRGCDAAGIPRWTPYRLRHTAATEVRKAYRLEAAQLVLGHARADVTQVYAERNEALAIRVAAERG